MHVVSVTAVPPRASDLASVDPQLVLLVRVQFARGKRLPLDVTALLRTDDNKVLGVARSVSGFEGAAMTLEAADEAAENGDVTRSLRLLLSLSPRQIEHINARREARPKGDVVLDCQVDVRGLASKVVNAWLNLDDSKGPSEAAVPVVYNRTHGVRHPFVTRYSNMWVLSGDKGRTFLESESFQTRQQVTIASSDWVHDYLSEWSGTRHVVIALPQPTLLTAAPTPALQERVTEAVAAANIASEKVERGEWSEVIEELRPVWELLRNQVDVQALLQRDAFTPEATTALMTSIAQQFEFASKFLHRVDRSNRRINPEIVAHKEDAMLCYAFALNVLNLITRKSQRLGPSAPNSTAAP